MLIVKSQDNLVEINNALNKMVNTETSEDIRDNDSKDVFQYQVPRVRASFTLKVAPDSTIADLPESANSSRDIKPVSKSESKRSVKASLPEYGPHLPVTPNQTMKDCKPTILAHPTLINNIPKAPKRVIADKSTTNTVNDDKDFEIPLEESLKAVEEFIRKEKELSKWHVGEDVLAKWKGNGLYYKAKILEIIPTGMVVVVFESYDVTEELDYKDLSKFFKKTNTFKKKGCPQEELKIPLENIDIVSAKKQVKVENHRISHAKRLRFISVFKRSSMARKKIMHFHRKVQNFGKLKSKRRSTIKNICLN